MKYEVYTKDSDGTKKDIRVLHFEQGVFCSTDSHRVISGDPKGLFPGGERFKPWARLNIWVVN